MQLPAYRFSCLETAVSDKGLPPKTYSPSLKTDLIFKICIAGSDKGTAKLLRSFLRSLGMTQRLQKKVSQNLASVGKAQESARLE